MQTKHSFWFQMRCNVLRNAVVIALPYPYSHGQTLSSPASPSLRLYFCTSVLVYLCTSVLLYAQRSLQLSDRRKQEDEGEFPRCGTCALFANIHTSILCLLRLLFVKNIFIPNHQEPLFLVIWVPLSMYFFRHEFRFEGWRNFPGCRDSLL